MPQSVWTIVSGLVLAVLAAALVAEITHLPLADWRSAGTDGSHLLRTALSLSLFAVPGALLAIILAEWANLRSWGYWLFCGLLLAVLGLGLLISNGADFDGMPSIVSPMAALSAMGLLAGLVYWYFTGQHSGSLASELASLSDGSLNRPAAIRRCRLCTLASLLIGLMPLALIGWYAIYHPEPNIAASLTVRAETDAARMLNDAGLPWVTLHIDDQIGHVTGRAADAASAKAAYAKASQVLEPMTGFPAMMADLQNDIKVP